MKEIITAAVIAVTLVAGYARADDKVQSTNTIVRTATLFTVGIDTKKSVPVSVVSADAPILNSTTNGGILTIKYTNDVLNVTIASPGYENKKIQLTGLDKMSMLGMVPEKKKKAPTMP